MTTRLSFSRSTEARARWTALAVTFLAGCDELAPRTSTPSGAAPPASSATVASVSGAASAPSAPAAATAAQLDALAAGTFGRLVDDLSERDAYFFSDNFVSNETSYLQPSQLLATRAATGGAYVGVGPEQNFTYIAMLKPKLAFIVDIRRQNMLQHLLYKAIFEEAGTRAHFLALLLGRPHDPEKDPGPRAGIEDLLVHAEAAKPDKALFEANHTRLVARIRSAHGVDLGEKDLTTIRRTHRAFFDDQLEIKFVLLESGGRKYPALRALLTTRAPDEKTGGFLATDDAYRRVRTLQQKNRIIPVVGDFAGDKALAGIAKELSRRRIPVSVFYVSNVEQYLLEDEKWRRWVRNIDALPSNEKSLFLRAYLNQGRAHPLEMKGHRTTTILQSFDHFKWRQRKRGYGSFWQLVNDGVLGSIDAGRAASAPSARK